MLLGELRVVGKVKERERERVFHYFSLVSWEYSLKSHNMWDLYFVRNIYTYGKK